MTPERIAELRDDGGPNLPLYRRRLVNGQLTLDLDLVPLEQLVAAVARRVGLRLVPMTSSPASDDTRVIAQSSVIADDVTAVERRRARWRRSQAARRARLRAMTSDDAMTRASVVVYTKNNNNSGVSDDRAMTDDRLPGLEQTGAAPDPTPAPPDDIRRRKLRTDTVDLLARQALDRAVTAGTAVHNPAGYVRATARTIAAQRASELDAAIETALGRWASPDAAHVVTVLLEREAPTRARRIEQPVDRTPPAPPAETRAGLASVRAALHRRSA